MRILLVCFGLFGVGLGSRMTASVNAAHPLVWDSMEKSAEAEPGNPVAEFTFSVTNKAAAATEITEIRASCGCTVLKVPSTPWVLPAGTSGSFTAQVDFRGKSGKCSKTVFVNSPAGMQMLRVTINIPETPESARERNRQMASVDRQAVFRGECASCHATPTEGKEGEALFQKACAICHSASPRASMVPELFTGSGSHDVAYWRKWISEGREGSLMPAFAQKNDGPLTDAQIASLIEFALNRRPTQPGKN